MAREPTKTALDLKTTWLETLEPVVPEASRR
jgi:hypothetical protein